MRCSRSPRSGARCSAAGRYDAIHSHEEGGLIGVVLAGAAARAAPLRHALEPAAAADEFRVQPLEPSCAGRSSRIERLMIRRSRVVIVICPSLEETVRAIDPRRADRADRERARLRGGGGDGGAGSGGARGRSGSTPATPLVLYTGTFEAYQGLDLLFEAMAVVADSPARRAAAAGRRQARSGRSRARAQARAAGIDDVTIFAGERPAAEIPAYPARRRRARVAALAGHEHAAEDLSVSAVGQADRGDAAADAHAGARRRDRDSDGRHRARVRRRHPGGARRPRARPRRSAAARALLAETKYSYEAYLERTRQACAALAISRVPPGAAVKDVA